MGTKSIQVPEKFHAYVKANKRDGETMGEALIRLAGGPHPSAVAGSLSDETAAGIRDAIEARDEPRGRERTVRGRR
ncbi:hypothetical protein BRC72_04980 [Halobacteriales archaeon QH_7_66_36]|nr:MAG: hypothetical protein BRC72_04980 [Halobacteriales archaeon QH_7_66_36]